MGWLQTFPSALPTIREIDECLEGQQSQWSETFGRTDNGQHANYNVVRVNKQKTARARWLAVCGQTQDESRLRLLSELMAKGYEAEVSWRVTYLYGWLDIQTAERVLRNAEAES